MSQTIQEKVLVEHVRVKTEKLFGEVAAALEAWLFGNANVTEVAVMIDRKLERLLADAMQ